MTYPMTPELRAILDQQRQTVDFFAAKRQTEQGVGDPTFTGWMGGRLPWWERLVLACVKVIPRRGAVR